MFDPRDWIDLFEDLAYAAVSAAIWAACLSAYGRVLLHFLAEAP